MSLRLEYRGRERIVTVSSSWWMSCTRFKLCIIGQSMYSSRRWLNTAAFPGVRLVRWTEEQAVHVSIWRHSVPNHRLIIARLLASPLQCVQPSVKSRASHFAHRRSSFFANEQQYADARRHLDSTTFELWFEYCLNSLTFLALVAFPST